VVGGCARCKILRHGCSNSNAGSKAKGKDKGTETEERSRPIRERRKVIPCHHSLKPLNICQRKRDDELPPAAYAIKTTTSARAPTPCQRSPTPLPAPKPKGVLPAASTSALTPEATEQRARSPHPEKFHHAADASPATRSLRFPSPGVPEDSDLEDLRARIIEFITRQKRLMHHLVAAQVELRTMALDIQTKFEKIAQKVNVQR